MSLKIVNIAVPNDAIIPEICGFSPEENYLMLKIGCECLMEGRKVVAGLTQKEIYKKLKEETKNEITKMEMDLIVEREICKKMEDKLTKMFEAEIVQYKTQIDALNNELNDYKKGSKNLIHAEVDKIREKYEVMYREKEKQVNYISENYEKMIVQYQSTKSTSYKGSEGEKQFEEYAEEFVDFKGFELKDKHTQGGEGDFHLHFEEFDVLVDVKNYKKKVPNDQREKIKKDLQKNEHLHFGWLVSLNSSIEKYDKSPIMYEWINTKQCLVYINNLCSFNDPRKILRIVWFICKELYNMTCEINVDEEELIKLKDDRFKFMDKIRNLRKNIREINTSMNATRNLVQLMDDELKLILENETNELVNSNISLFDAWWEENIDVTKEDILTSSTDLWTKFKQDNKTIINDMNLTGDKFKQYLKSKVPMSAILLRNKNINSAFDIKGIRLKIVEDKVIVEKEMEDKIEVEFNEELIKKKKVIKKKKEDYFDEELDNKIINDYNAETDIMTLSTIYNVRPWQIVSLLMNKKIITKRDQSRGYDKYKETDEYKQKIIKK